MQDCSIEIPQHWYRAKAWADWGYPVSAPVYGAVAIFDRKGGGHVGIVTGMDTMGRIMVLGGNQGNRVSEIPFDVDRVVEYRWPKKFIKDLHYGALPIIVSTAHSSRNEA